MQGGIRGGREGWTFKAPQVVRGERRGKGEGKGRRDVKGGY